MYKVAVWMRSADFYFRLFTKTISFWPSGPIDVYERITDRHIRAVKKIFYEVFATDASILTRNVHAASYNNH